jgi:hypothetical protein
MRVAAFAVAGAAALSTAPQSTAAEQGGGASAVWWYVAQSGQAPQRQLAFLDRAAVTHSGDAASARVLHIFERPRGDVRSFAITYAFRCAARHYQSRDVVFDTTANRFEREDGVVDDWSPVVPNSIAATVLEVACFSRFERGARAIADTPMDEAARILGFQPLPIAEDPAPRGAAPALRTGRLMPRDQLVQCLRGTGPDTPACREARASAERGRAARTGSAQPAGRGGAAAGGESYAQLLDRIIQADSEGWEFNTYESGSMQIVDMRRDARGNLSMLRGNYRYGRGNPRYYGTILGGVRISTGPEEPWVEAHFVNGRLQCLQYHNRPSCITSTRDFYREGHEAESQHHEYCQITHNC